jgi:hypothetical protein
VSELCWLKSSFSEDGGNNCVEVASLEGGGVAIRESDSPAQMAIADRAAFSALLASVKAGGLTHLPRG